jgi:death-on-curing protein
MRLLGFQLLSEAADGGVILTPYDPKVAEEVERGREFMRHLLRAGELTGRWVNRPALLLHAESLAEHGGSAGLRDEGLCDSALARPQSLVVRGTPDLAALAASYGVGLPKNHANVAGNKRMDFLAVGLFLANDGYASSALRPLRR